MHRADLPSLQAGSTVELAVVLIELAVGAAHGHVVGPACLQAPALWLACLPAEHAAAPTVTELLPAGGCQHVEAKPCQTHKHCWWVTRAEMWTAAQGLSVLSSIGS